MADQWFIHVLGKDYGPADLSTLREWKADGRVLPTNPARRADVDLWQTAAEIPGLFQVEPPVQVYARDQRSQVSDQPAIQAQTEVISPQSEISNQQLQSKPPTRNILVETFRIYFRGFFQFFGLSLLSIAPIVCAALTSRFIDTAPGVNVDLRTLVAGAFGLCMIVLRLVMLPIYIAGIQILAAELATGQRISFLSVLNGAVKYWPRVAGLCIFVYVVFCLILALGILVLSMTAAASAAGSVFWIVVTLGLACLQLWCFCRFFVFTLFWQQFAVLENLPAFDALRKSNELTHSGSNLPWYQRPLWRGAFVVSVWIAFAITLALIAWWPRFVADWPVIRDTLNQLSVIQDPQIVAQDLATKLSQAHAFDYRALGLNIGARILQPLLGIAFVVLYLDSRGDV